MPLHSQVLQTFLLLAYFPLCVTLSRFPILALVLKSFKNQESNPLLRVSPSWYWGLTQCQQVLGKKWNVSDFFFSGCICFSKSLVINLFLLKFSRSHISKPYPYHCSVPLAFIWMMKEVGHVHFSVSIVLR